ncbi:FAD-dependent oxidoreductase|uniref:Glycerol-3-phosphate dehydrogenase n=1 Tax=Dendrosporobacter quercicolus TaxID=146817 RepID=A0A1G9UVY6_9FIRM|nr:NAD(P)/FAD-dependent oxidoreductase [Dendrosporobacter quercicolus]NSL48010.1 FAD-dependent oxidoreductase [Dendrosporobacter quercicolus DSM 1736]SDM64016.1 glycerol-3-phosphate dehydrogenase [Dendrosporobacter quercicolus]
MYDVCIIGAGVVGLNIARELAKYRVSVCILERNDDVGCGCSKANSGIVHGGYSDEPGTLKAQLCVRGNRMFEQLEKELNFGYRNTGSLVLAFAEEDFSKLQQLYEYGTANGVQGLAIITGEQARAKEPYLSGEVKGALYCANAGVTSPYEFAVALAENAVLNGVELKLNQEVTRIEQAEDGLRVFTGAGQVAAARYVLNAAGIHSDTVARMLGIDDYRITPRRGQYVVLDKDQNYLVKSVIFQVPTRLGKGILLTATYHGNLMIGPNAEEVDDKEDVGTDEKTLAYIVQTARKSVPGFNMKRALRSFAGNRPVSNQKDWVIAASRVKGFINLVGIDSPGLTASPAIAVKVTGLLQDKGLALVPNPAFQPYRKPVIVKKGSEFAGDVDAADPERRIICRCEKVTEAEIIDSLYRGIEVRSVGAVGRRTRAGYGSCQGAFCGPRVKELIARELQLAVEEVQPREQPAAAAQRAKRLELYKLH